MNKNELEKKKLFLLDMDGTIYLEDKLFEKTLELLDYINTIRGKYIFITNNSSKSVNDYISKLKSLDIKVDESNFLTSAQATSLYLQNNFKKKKAYILGTESFKNELISDNIDVYDTYDESIDLLVVGYDTELTYSKLEDACKLLSEGVDFIATNPDLVCPTNFGFIPDCGSICKMLKIATKRNPKYIGKPNKELVELALKSTNFSKEETLVIGDRLYTDIACGINAGVTTAVVLSGETKSKDLVNTEFMPDYSFEDVNELYFKLKTQM